MPGCNSNADLPETSSLDVAVATLIAGGVVVYPTETVYGLGVDASSEAALARLIEVKGREPGKPISVLVSDEHMLGSLVRVMPPRALRLARRFWPGPLTLVLPALPSLSSELTGGSGTIGVRISSCWAANELVRRVGRAITTTSANPAGAVPPASVDRAREYFGERVDAYVDGGIVAGEPASTVAAVEGEMVRILRAGAISAADIHST